MRKIMKRHRRKSPQGGWGMGSKEPIPKENLFIICYNIRGMIYQFFFVLIQAKNNILQLYKNFKNFVTKERPLGGFERSKSHFGQHIPFLSVRNDKGNQAC